jgi:hypothetical protein
LRGLEGQSALAGGNANGPQAPKRAQLIFGIIKLLRYFEGLCPDCLDFINGTLGIEVRFCERGEHFHLTLRVPADPGPQNGQCLFDPYAALVQQREMHPQGNGGGGQRYSD